MEWKLQPTRAYLHHLPPDHVLYKLDFKNAINSIKRDKILEVVKETIPELPLCLYLLLLTFNPLPP